MSESSLLADEIEAAARRLLGQQATCHTIVQWCHEHRQLLKDIEGGRGLSLPSIAIIGAKGQGKTWIARQMILDRRLAELLPSGVLSKEATTHMTWIGPSPPDAIDPSRETYLPCPSHCMLDLGRPYMILDTPGYTDDDPIAAAIAKEAMSLAPIKLIVARRDQMRSAIHAQLAALTEGAVCLPVITCTPLKEISSHPSRIAGHAANPMRASESLRSDLEWFIAALSSSAPSSRILEPILIADFEADGDEDGVGSQLGMDLRQRLSKESMESIAATKSNRIAAASDRLRHRVAKAIEAQVPQLASSVRRLHASAESLPTQAIETVLGSKHVLKTAIRDRVRADVIAGTSLMWFPYRTLLNILGFSHGAWDRLLLSMTGSIPSIFGTFAAWARNWGQAREAQREIQSGIRDQLNRQIQDRLQPSQQQFYRAVDRIRGEHPEARTNDPELKVRLSGVDELQTQAREVFEFTLDQHRTPRSILQTLGLFASLLFWSLFAAPIVAIYRQYFMASYHTWKGEPASMVEFPHPSFSMLATAGMLSLFPVLLLAMLVMSWFQRNSRLNTLAESVYAAELHMVGELKSNGVIQLHYEDPLLAAAQFLVHLERTEESKEN
jgi:hypothetical protein